MYKYLLCIILGILVFILWNRYNGFSVGIQTLNEQCKRPVYVKGDSRDGCDVDFVCKGTRSQQHSTFRGICVDPQDLKDWGEFDDRQHDILTTLGWNKDSWDDGNEGPFEHELTQREINLLRMNGFSDIFLNMFDFPAPAPAPALAPAPAAGGGAGGRRDSCSSIISDEEVTGEMINMLANTNVRDISCLSDMSEYDGKCQAFLNTQISNKFDLIAGACPIERGPDDETIHVDFLNCIKYHTLDYLCQQSCATNINTLLPVTHERHDKNMENAGFEYRPDVIDPNNVIFQDFLRIINADIEKDSPVATFYGYNEQIRLYFGEYMLLKYLQKIHPGFEILKIDDGIFYVNGNLYIFKTDNIALRSDMKPQISSMLPDTTLLYKVYSDGGVGTQKNLHSDYQNTAEYKQDELFPGLPEDESYRQSDKYQHFMNRIGTREMGNTPIENYLITFPHVMGLISGLSITPFLFDNKHMLNYFNIWLKIDGTPNAKTLAFVDIVDEPGLDKDTALTSMWTDTGNPDITRINKNKPGYLLNINALPERHRVLYTPDKMDNGDILIFDTTSTPHKALVQNDDEWRLSVETRYAVLQLPFNLEELYEITSDSLVYRDNMVGITDDTHIISLNVSQYFSRRFREFKLDTQFDSKTMINFKDYLNTTPTILGI